VMVWVKRGFWGWRRWELSGGGVPGRGLGRRGSVMGCI